MSSFGKYQLKAANKSHKQPDSVTELDESSTSSFKFKSYINPGNSSATVTNSRVYSDRFGISKSSKYSSDKVPNSFTKNAGKIQKAKKGKPNNANLECFNLLEKEKFRQLIEQHENYRPVQSANQRNVYKNFIHSSPTKTRDDTSDLEKCQPLIASQSHRVSAGYSRRISLSLDSKPDSLLNNNNKPTLTSSFFNKYASNSTTNPKLPSTRTTKPDNATIEIIDISNITDKLKTKTDRKRVSGMGLVEDLENFEREKKEYYAQYHNLKSSSRSKNAFEKSIDDRLRSNQSMIENVLKKSQSKLETNLMVEEERYKMKKRQRQEKDIIERELAHKFTQQLHLDSTKHTIKYLEEDLPVQVENDFPDLDDQQTAQINNALQTGAQDQVLCNEFNISICRKDVQTLWGLNWLNDEVINFYMSLICERSKKNVENLKVHAFTTFFYPKLVKDGYATLRRWTRKIDVFGFDLILVPIHLGLHWTLAVIDFECREIRYYDSMNGNNGECLKALRNYLTEEHKDKKSGVAFDLSEWNFLHNKNLPQQMNGSDCGMFACKYAEYLSRGRTTFNFNQSHMPYFRRRMVWEILNTKLM